MSKLKEECYEEWAGPNQEFELRYHQGGNMRNNEELWNSQWSDIFESFGYNSTSFDESMVIADVGCGSRPGLDYFSGVGEIHSLDPLMDDYLKIEAREKDWAHHPSEHCHSVPGEERVEDLVGKCDFVLSWNALDHGYDWKSTIRNIMDYIKPGGTLLLGTDTNPHAYHIGIDDPEELCNLIESEFDIVDDRGKKHCEYPSKLGCGLHPDKDSWGLWERTIMVRCKKRIT